MSSRAIVVSIFICLLMFCISITMSFATENPFPKVTVNQGYGELPLSFIENGGQIDERAKFTIAGPEGTVFFTEKAVVFNLDVPDENELTRDLFSISSSSSGSISKTGDQKVGLWISFDNPNPDVSIEGIDRMPGKINRLVGNDPDEWKSGIACYSGVAYRNVWTGIDIIYHGEQNHLKYDVLVSPGAKLESIRLRYEGADGLALDRSGNLVIRTTAGTFKEAVPGIYQEKDGRKIWLKGGFKLDGDTVGFYVRNYDPSLPLVIDPESDVWWSTFLGGSKYDRAAGVAVDYNGCVYVTGTTTSSDFPIAPGAISTPLNGEVDIFVAQIDPSGSYLVYCTYLGGSVYNYQNTPFGQEGAAGIAVGKDGCAYVAGWTECRDFPTIPYTSTLPSKTNNFVVKLNAEGTSIVYSKIFGGHWDDYAYAIAVDNSGCAYVAGTTYGYDYPVLQGCADTTFSGYSDGFITKFTPNGENMAYSTFLGGNGNQGYDKVFGIAVDSSGCAYVTGETWAYDFPTTPGAFSVTMGDALDDVLWDAFVTKIDASGTRFEYSTYLGGAGEDTGKAIAVDSSGCAYVTGRTTSSNFPTTTGAFDTTFNGQGGDAFVTKLSPDGRQLRYSTFLGGRSFYYDDIGCGIAVDLTGCAYIVGHTSSQDFPMVPGAFDTIYNGGIGDAFLTLLDPQGSQLIYSTFLGGASEEEAGGVALDPYGCVYVVGETWSYDFPVVPGAFDTGYDIGDAFITKLIIRPVLCIASTAGGTTDPAPGDYAYTRNTQVQIRAIPNPGYTFVGWEGVGNPYSSNITVVMDGPKYVKACFIPNTVSVKMRKDGDLIGIDGSVVTAVFPGYFYIESETRESGIRVNWSSAESLPIGSRVYVSGSLETNSDGEKCIRASSVTPWSGSERIYIQPLNMTNKALGGGDWNWDSLTGKGQQGITGAAGLNNIGLLVRTCGRLVDYDKYKPYFFIDDGSGVNVKVITTEQPALPRGPFVYVTGISSCEKDENGLHRVIRVRYSNAIQTPDYGTGINGKLTMGGVKSFTAASSHPAKSIYFTVSAPYTNPNMRMRIHFSQIQLGGGDRLVIRDYKQTIKQTFSNTYPLSDVWSDWIDGNYATVELQVYSTTNAYGFAIDKYETPVIPMAQAPVSLVENQTTVNTDSNGFYKFLSLTPGTYTVKPVNMYAERSWEPRERVVTVQEGSVVTNQNFNVK